MIEIIKITISNQSSKVELLDTIYTNNKEQYRVHFIFDTDDWNNYNKMVVFDRVKNYDTPIGINITEGNSELVEIINEKEFYCVLPWEVITQPGYFNISIYGSYTNENGELLTKNYILPDKFTIQNGGDKTVYPRIPTPNMYEQLAAAYLVTKDIADEAMNIASAAEETVGGFSDRIAEVEEKVKEGTGVGKTTEQGGEIFNDYTNNKATGLWSHAEGSFVDVNGVRHFNQASGVRSHVEGSGNKATTYDTHAEGSLNEASGNQAHVEGYQTKATNFQAHAEGSGTIASGVRSHAEGLNTKAQGSESHSEGNNTTASGPQSHAEGSGTTGSGDQAHGEGYQTTASGAQSHSEGHSSKAIGARSHAGGLHSEAQGSQSFVHGTRLIATETNQFVVGKFNDETEKGLFVVGNGSGDTWNGTTRTGKNAFVVKEDGSVIIGKSNIDNDNAVVNSKLLKDYVKNNSCDGVGQTTEANGEIFNDYENNKAFGEYSSASGFNSQAGVRAYKFKVKGYSISNPVISINNREGIVINDLITFYSAQLETIFVDYARVTGIPETIPNTIAIDRLPPNFSMEDVENEYITILNKPNLNYDSYVGNSAHAEGYESFAFGDFAHAEGQSTIANGKASHAEGKETQALHNEAHAEGYQTLANQYQAHAEGRRTLANHVASHAEGEETNASGYASHAEGQLNNATNDAAHAEGYGTKATGIAAHSEGKGNIASGMYSHAEGEGTNASGYASHAEGGGTKALSYRSHAEGNGTVANNSESHAEGHYTTSSGTGSHSEGHTTNASSTGAHAEGQSTQATGYASHAEGFDTIASGFGAHAEGGMTEANGNYSHASGVGTQATSEGQTVVGKYNQEDNSALFIVGCGSSDTTRLNAFVVDSSGYATLRNQGILDNSVVIYKTIKDLKSELLNKIPENFVGAGGASGEVFNIYDGTNIAQGGYSHAEGLATQALRGCSHAGGYKTIANADAQYAIGMWNKEDTNALLIVGNGSSEEDRKNAFVVNKDGTATVQTTGTEDNNVVNYKQLVDYVSQNSGNKWEKELNSLFNDGKLSLHSFNYNPKLWIFDGCCETTLDGSTITLDNPFNDDSPTIKIKSSSLFTGRDPEHDYEDYYDDTGRILEITNSGIKYGYAFSSKNNLPYPDIFKTISWDRFFNAIEKLENLTDVSEVGQ